MIALIKINKLRSFAGSYDIPLNRFNLLHGNNGAGKSSIIEAIQLAITGNSERTSHRNVAELVEEIRTDGHFSDLLVEIINDKNEVLSGFNDSGCRSGFAELLEKYYKMSEHHKTAQSLLRTLFSTHNLLTQEKIIKLLDSESFEAFAESIEEMIIGHDLVQRWEKIQLLSDNLAKQIIEIENKKGEIAQNLIHIEQHLKEWDEISEKDILEKFKELISLCQSAQVKFKEEPKDKLLANLLKWIYDVKEVFDGIKNNILRIEELNIFNQGIIVLAELYKIQVETRDKLQKLELSKEKLPQKLDNLKKLNVDLNKNVLETSEKVNKLDSIIENSDKALKKLKVLDEWRLEILANLKSQEIEKELIRIRSRSEILERIISIKSELPARKMFESSIDEFKKAQDEIKEISNLASIQKDNQAKLQDELTKLQEEYKGWGKSLDKQVSLYETLGEITEKLMSLEMTNTCPTCGHDFIERDKLLNAINTTVENRRNKQGVKLPDALKSLTQIKVEIEEKKKLIDHYSRMLVQIDTKMNSYSQKIKHWLDQFAIIVNLLHEGGIADLQKPVNGTFLKSLNELNSINLSGLLEDITDKINLLKSSVITIWLGLRRDEFIENKEFIYDQFDEKDLNSVIAILQDSATWKQYLDKALSDLSNDIKAKEKEVQNLRGLTIALEENNKNLEQERANLKECEESISKTRVSLKGIFSLTSEVERLNKHFLSHQERIDIEEIKTKIEEIIAKIRSLENSIVIVINSHKDRANHEKRGEEIRNLMSTYDKKLKIMDKLKIRIASVRGLEDRTQSEWDKYESNINSLFSKLHSPPDYEKITLNKTSKIFQVISRSTNEVKPATVLSSGQRAALAISIFWTLNLYGVGIPPIMLMDEPIQQIDDLNSLNFLDSLRWIVENTDRQVILSTANNKLAGLIRRKFSYLGENYNEVHIERYFGIRPIVRCINGMDEVYYKSA